MGGQDKPTSKYKHANVQIYTVADRKRPEVVDMLPAGGEEIQ